MEKAEKKALAESLYINTSLSRKEIAKQCKCSETSLRAWIKDGGWEDIKESRTITKSHLLQESFQQLKAINDKIRTEMKGVPNKELSDAKAVIRKEIEALSDQPLYRYVEIMEEFQGFITKNNPTDLHTVTKLSMAFIEAVASKKF